MTSQSENTNTSQSEYSNLEQPGGSVLLSPDYIPSENEPYMNPRHLEFFRQKLNEWKAELLRESAETIHNMQEQTGNEPDIADRASTETDRSLELRARDRERKLISKIDEALRRIDDGTYGYCEETGDPIGITRLMARPIATLSLEAQERHEKEERVYRED
jgi:DnaK suppressor protein